MKARQEGIKEVKFSTTPNKPAFYQTQIFLIVCLLSLLGLAAQAKTAPCSSEGHGQVEKPFVGEEVRQGKTFIVSKLLIKARPEKVWQILSDYNNASRIFPILKESELLQDRGATKITRHVIAPTGVPGTFEYVLEIHESAPHTMEWHRLRGDFREVDGFWKLEAAELGHHTMVTYASYVNGGLLMPQVLIRRQFRIDMPNALVALRNKAEIDTRLAVHRAAGAPAQ